MTLDELRQLYTEAVKIIKKERTMREYVFRTNEVKRAEKLAEIDRLEEILRLIKDAAKMQLAEMEQPKLLDVPAKYD
jgi:hypothetical protein